MNRTHCASPSLAVVGLSSRPSTLFTVQQTQQVLITQFGQPIRVISEPGPALRRSPSSRSVITFDRRLLDFDAPGEEVILGDQRRLIVDSFTRYRITDPLRFYQTVGATEAGIRARLNSDRLSPRCAACSATSRCCRCCRPTARGSWARSASQVNDGGAAASASR